MQPARSTEAIGPWDEMALRKMEEWDPEWADSCRKMSSNPWKNGVLSRKLIELICIGLNAAGANLNADGIQRHIRAALDAGATDSFPCFASVRRLFAFSGVNDRDFSPFDCNSGLPTIRPEVSC